MKVRFNANTNTNTNLNNTNFVLHLLALKNISLKICKQVSLENNCESDENIKTN